MQRPAEAAVPFDLAREIATREGTKAVLDGDVVRLGSSYVLSARLVSALDGRELATFRETAENDAALVPAVGKLSRSIRERVGESLKGLQNAKALERVSTPSLAALRKYVEGARVEEVGGDRERAMQLLQEAVAIDSGFAMAWRKIAVMYTLMPNARQQTIDAAARAYRHRERLTDEERDLTEAAYYTYGPAPDPDKVIAAYEQLLARDSLNTTALNNLAVAYGGRRNLDRGLPAYRRAAFNERAAAVSLVNLAAVASRLYEPALADTVADLFARRFPKSVQRWEIVSYQLLARKRYDSLALLSRGWADTGQRQRMVYSATSFVRDYEFGHGRTAVGLQASERGAATITRLTKGQPQLLDLLLDSAGVAAFFDGDRTQTHRLLQGILSPANYEQLPAASRPWSYATILAALAGDASSAEALAAAYRRDIAGSSRDPSWDDARVAGQVALARGQYAEAVKQLQRAGQIKTTPNTEESYLIATAFDRAGTRDSAIAWFTRVVKPPRGVADDPFIYGPAAHKRLAELLDAKGDAAGAIEHYDVFATLWKDAEPSRQPVVKAARDRAEQLRLKKNPG
jgi:tetratricopeptide (TPR) repeat protein